jgi:hypothetical protein
MIMRDLIKQILREYREPKINIFRLNPNSKFLKEILLESEEQNNNSDFIINTNTKKDKINYYIATDKNKKYTYPLPISTSEFGSILKELTNYFISNYNYPEKNPNSILHNYQNDEGVILKKKFRLEKISYHFIERLYRKSDPSYSGNTSIINPEKTEGIDLFLNNLNDICKKIDTSYYWKKGPIYKKEFYLLKTSGLPFWIIFSLYKSDTGDVIHYVEFITQMKGLESIRKNTTKIPL